MLLFPVNEFMDQEPESNENILKFASKSLNITQLSTSGNVKMFLKSGANDPSKCTESACSMSSTGCCSTNNPVYVWLRSQLVNDPKLSWNFDKFVIAPNGSVVPPKLEDSDLADKIEPIVDELLAEMRHG